MEDYRLVDGQCPFERIHDRKDNLLLQIKQKHPRSNNHYNIVKTKNDPLHKQFAMIYNERCGYCGITYQVRPFSDFEIDHFLCKSSGKDGVNLLDNLIYSCHFCNYKKHEYLIDESARSILNPDFGISETFYRDEMMHIRIRDEYQSNGNVIDFYNKIQFSNERRRIEFLLMSLISYKNRLVDEKTILVISKIIDIIRDSYNHKY